MNKIIGTYDWATSNTWTPTEESRIHLGNDVSGTILASGNHNGVIEMENDSKPNRLFNIYGEDKGTGYAGNVWDKEGVSPTLTTMEGGNRQPFIVEDDLKESEKLLLPNGNVKRYINSDIEDEFKPGQMANLEYPNGYGHGNRVTDISTTITRNSGGYEKVVKEKNLRIRKLTAKECWRLQGFDDEDYDKAAKVNSESQLYKQAGNSIAVPCLTGIITNIFNVDRESK